MSDPRPPATPAPQLLGLRYSLPEMLDQIKRERLSGGFATERLDQHEIVKIFKPQKRRRVTQPAQ